MTPTNIADDTCKVVLHSLQLLHRRLCDAVEQGELTVVQARAYYAGYYIYTSFHRRVISTKAQNTQTNKNTQKKRWNTTQSQIWYKICELSGECENPVGTHRKLMQSN